MAMTVFVAIASGIAAVTFGFWMGRELMREEVRSKIRFLQWNAQSKYKSTDKRAEAAKPYEEMLRSIKGLR